MIRSFLSSCLIVGFTVVAISYQTEGFRVFTSESKRRLAIQEFPQQVIPVLFETHRDELISWDAFSGSYVIVDFIYTQCETLCHALGFEFAEIQKNAIDLIENEQVHLLTISFDAENDPPSALREYISRFSADSVSWTAARSTQVNDEAALLKQFGVVAIPDGEGGFVHNAALHLVSPKGALMKIVDYEDAEEMMRFLRKSLSSSNTEDQQIISLTKRRLPDA